MPSPTPCPVVPGGALRRAWCCDPCPSPTPSSCAVLCCLWCLLCCDPRTRSHGLCPVVPRAAPGGPYVWHQATPTPMLCCAVVCACCCTWWWPHVPMLRHPPSHAPAAAPLVPHLPVALVAPVPVFGAAPRPLLHLVVVLASRAMACACCRTKRDALQTARINALSLCK